MDEYIKREDAFETLQSRLDSISQMSYLDMDWHELDIMRNAIENAIDDIGEVPTADVQPVDRWISVKDRLPEEGVSVLICTNEGIRGVSARYGNRFFITIVEAFTEDTVTYWQPLPEPPKDGDVE